MMQLPSYYVKFFASLQISWKLFLWLFLTLSFSSPPLLMGLQFYQTLHVLLLMSCLTSDLWPLQGCVKAAISLPTKALSPLDLPDHFVLAALSSPGLASSPSFPLLIFPPLGSLLIDVSSTHSWALFICILSSPLVTPWIPEAFFLYLFASNLSSVCEALWRRTTRFLIPVLGIWDQCWVFFSFITIINI